MPPAPVVHAALAVDGEGVEDRSERPEELDDETTRSRPPRPSFTRKNAFTEVRVLWSGDVIHVVASHV
jgi:hypothetical protein